VKLVNLRAGQDSGYFFLEESVAALTYAGDNGIGRGRHEPRLPAGRGEGEPPGQPELPDDAQRGQRGPDHLRAGPEQAQGVLLGYGHGEADLSAPGGDIYDGAPDNKPEYREPHAAGVVALAVSRFGERRRGEFGLNPRVTEFVLRRTATDTACPEPRTFTYGFTTPPSTAPHTWDATCEGTPENNGFYGDGIVDAERVASLGGDSDSD
jgi:hypothetical protein